MRIIYVAGSPVPSKAANSVHVMKMSHALADLEHQVTLCCPKATDSDLSKQEVYDLYGVKPNFEFNPHTPFSSRIGLILYAMKNAALAKREKADFVFSRCLFTAWFCSIFGIKTLFERHDAWENNPTAAKIFKRLMASKNCLGLVVISKALEDQITSKFGIERNRMIIAADAADPLPETSAPPPFEKVKGKINVGYVGHLYKGRGIDIIADAAKQLPGMEFHIVGGTDEDLTYWRHELKSHENIHFYGHMSHNAASRYLQHFDVLLAPYQKKVSVAGGGNTVQWMSPLKIFEYMSTGKPMISSDLPVLHEVLKPDKNAYLCIADDVDDWVSVLQSIQKNPTKAAQIGATAKEDFLQNYTWLRRSEKIIEELPLK